MSNKGFTIIEVLTTLVIISLLAIIIGGLINSTVAANKEETYKLMKNSIAKASSIYIKECTSGIIECDFSYDKNNTFYAKELKKYGYFDNLNSPIDAKNLGECLLIKATYDDNGTSIIDIIDTCY